LSTRLRPFAGAAWFGPPSYPRATRTGRSELSNHGVRGSGTAGLCDHRVSPWHCRFKGGPRRWLRHADGRTVCAPLPDRQNRRGGCSGKLARMPSRSRISRGGRCPGRSCDGCSARAGPGWSATIVQRIRGKLGKIYARGEYRDNYSCQPGCTSFRTFGPTGWDPNRRGCQEGFAIRAQHSPGPRLSSDTGRSSPIRPMPAARGCANDFLS